MYKIYGSDGGLLGTVGGYLHCRKTRDGAVIIDERGDGILVHLDGKDMAYNLDGAPSASIVDCAGEVLQAQADQSVILDGILVALVKE